MTDPRPLLDDPVVRRLQQAFAHEEPATELPEVLRRAADYLAVEPPATAPKPAAGPGLAAADLVAARRREPAAITRIYAAYAPSLFQFFVAAVGDHRAAQDLTGDVFVSAIEALPHFRGPVQALGGWLFRIARHDLYDYRRAQAPTPQPTGGEADARALQQALQAVLDRQDDAPPAALPELVRRLSASSGQHTDAPLSRLSPRERQVLALLGRGFSNAQVGRELLLSPHSVRAHLQNILRKLEVHAKLQAATLALQHGWAPEVEDPEERSIEQLAGGRLTAALQQLPPDQREVLLLRMAAGLAAPEVAAVVDKTTGAVKALQHRALANLARHLRRSTSDHPDATEPGPPHPGLDLHPTAPRTSQRPEQEPPTHLDDA